MRLDRFMEIYERELATAVEKYPDAYPWFSEKDGNGNPRKTVASVASKMREAFKNRSYNKDGHAIRATCKALSIPYTYTGINNYLSGL